MFNVSMANRNLIAHYFIGLIFAFVCLMSTLLLVTENRRLSSHMEKWREEQRRAGEGRIPLAQSHIPVDFLKPSEVWNFDVDATNCSALFAGDQLEIKRAINYQKKLNYTETDSYDVIRRASDCKTYAQDAHFITRAVSEEERDFPIAYSIMMYRSPGMFERLLRSIYRPQNYYCVHVDLKADPAVHQAIQGIANCLPNVVLAPRRVIVKWGSYTELWPDFICMEKLWEFADWRYWINLTGEEFPLKTNLELVRVLKMINGANLVPAQTKFNHRERYKYYFNGTVNTYVLKPPPPINITMAHHMTHVALVRGAVDFILHDPRALAFRKWSRSMWFPDEQFWASLYLSPHLGMPGAYTGSAPFHASRGHYQLVTRYKLWNYEEGKCYGRYQRTICLVSVGQLHILAQSPKLFVNKFKEDFHPLAYDCLEQFIFRKVLQETQGLVTPLNKTYYTDMDFVKNHI